jgi:hypothetical protein
MLNSEIFQDSVEDKGMTYTQKQLLEGAVKGEGISQPLLIGGAPAAKGVTFEEARDDLYKLMNDGLIELDNQWQPKLTDKGLETLSNER